MLHNRYVMLCYMTHVMLYNTHDYVIKHMICMLYNTCYVIKYNKLCYLTKHIICYVI